MEIATLAAQLDGQLNPPDLKLEITGVGTMEEATADQITFLANPKYLAKLPDCRAGAILVAPGLDAPDLRIPRIEVAHPYYAFARAIALFHSPPPPKPGIHPTVILGEGVELGENVTMGAYVVVGDRARIGDHVVIHPHCAIYADAVIGAGSILHSHVAIREGVILGERVIVQNGAVIGGDGFGFVPMPDGTFYKILQAGTVTLGDDVEIQALSAIDRATIGTTTIGPGTKVDNLVQVGHGCKIGDHTLLCGQVGLAGSTTVGNHVILAGQVGAAGHLTIGDRVQVGASSGINHSIPPNTQVSGYPAIDHKLWLRVSAALKLLPDLIQRVRRLERG